MEDIKTKKDIAHLVNSFYEKVQVDALIGPVFNEIIEPEDWPMHLERMCSFWSTVLLNDKSFKGNPFAKHMNLSIDETHFARWIQLFNQAVGAHFEGDKANEAMERAGKMSTMFESKLRYMRANPNRFPIM